MGCLTSSLLQVWSCLVYTLEGRHGLAFVLVECGANDLTVGEVNLAVRLLLEAESVLHPVLVITVGEVLTSVCTTGLLAVGGRDGGLGTVVGQSSFPENITSECNLRASEQIPELKSLNKVRVPDHAAVLDADLRELSIDLLHLADTFVKTLLGTENADISLHSLLHRQTNLGSALGTVGSADLIKDLDVLGTGVGREGLVLVAGVEVVADGVGDGTSEDDEIEKGVGTETVSTVDRDTSGLTAGEQTRNNLVVALLVDGQDLTSVASGNTTHVVVDSGKDRNGLLGDIDTSKDTSSLRNTRKALSEDIGGKMAELEEDVVLVSTDTTAVANLHGH